MMQFILSQLIGLALFVVVNVALYFYLCFKRSQIYKEKKMDLRWRFRTAYFLLIIFFMLGLTHRVLTIYRDSEILLERLDTQPDIFQTQMDSSVDF